MQQHQMCLLHMRAYKKRKQSICWPQCITVVSCAIVVGVCLYRRSIACKVNWWGAYIVQPLQRRWRYDMHKCIAGIADTQPMFVSAVSECHKVLG